jgi:HEAT repeat protein
MGKLAQPATEALIAVLADRDGSIRAIAIHALGNMGPELGPMLDRARNAVGNSLMDASADVRLSALETLGRWGPSLVDMATTSKIEKLEKDSSKEVRETAKLVLGRLRGPAPK